MLGVINLELSHCTRSRLETSRILDSHLCKTMVGFDLRNLTGWCHTSHLGSATLCAICRNLRTQRCSQDIRRDRTSRPRLLLRNILEGIRRTCCGRRNCDCVLGSTQRSLGIDNAHSVVLDTRDGVNKVGLGKSIRATRTERFGGSDRRINVPQVQPRLLAIHISGFIHDQ
jgi:hypothetical protein